MKKPVNLSLDPRLVERARLAASADGVSLSAWVSRLIASATRDVQPVPPAAPKAVEPRRAVPRNSPCPCDSGEKFKRCCGKNT